MKKQSLIMKESLLKGDFKGFSDCLNYGWFAKRNAASSISNAYIEELYKFAIDNGSLSAKISGAGGGGFMMIYCDPCRRISLIRALKEKQGMVLTPSFTEIGTQAWRLS